MRVLWWRVTYWFSRKISRLGLWFVWRLPRKLAYWCAIRVISNATVGQYSNQIVSDLLAMDALKRWDDE